MSTREATTLAAIVARLIPSDEHGPGAREAGVIRYLERALAGEYREHRSAYAEGLAAVDALASAGHGGEFAALAPERQDAILIDLERQADPFFELVRRHALEGMFGDPCWGGNEGGVGWDLLGYPGPRHVWTEAEQQLDAGPARREER